MTTQLSTDIMIKHANIIDWKQVCSIYSFSDDDIRVLAKHIDWNIVHTRYSLSPELLRDIAETVNWSEICQYFQLSESVLDEFADKVDRVKVGQYQKLSEAFIHRHRYELSWAIALQFQRVSEEFIVAHEEHVMDDHTVYATCRYRSVSESFIRRFIDHIHWSVVEYQTVSEEFLSEYINELADDCQDICKNHVLSEAFMRRHLEVLWRQGYSQKILTTQKLSESFMTYMRECGLLEPHGYRFMPQPWDLITKHQTFSIDFINEHEDVIYWDELGSNPNIDLDVLFAVRSRVPMHDNLESRIKGRQAWRTFRLHEQLCPELFSKIESYL